MFLLNSRLSLFAATLSRFRRVVLHATRAPLLPKLRGYFAEFLRESYLAHLGILYLTTCVGFGYGHHYIWLRRFSRQRGIYALRLRRVFLTQPQFITPERICLPRLPTPLDGTMSNRPPAYSLLRPDLAHNDITVVREYQPVVHRLRLSASP